MTIANYMKHDIEKLYIAAIDEIGNTPLIRLEKFVKLLNVTIHGLIIKKC